MLSLKQYITEGGSKRVLTHLTHLEDRIIYAGVSGARECIDFLRAVRNNLAGKSDKKYQSSLKLDGAPSLVAGVDPADGKFFVAKKSIFNKNPKLYKTRADVIADTKGDLQTKMLIALEEFAKLGIQGIIQGDLMFTKSDVRYETVDGEKFLTFQANTIVYAVPVGSIEETEINAANIGIVWHTYYVGDSIESMQAKGGFDASSLNKVSTIWSQDALMRDISGQVLMTKKETDAVTKELSEAGKIFRTIAGKTLRELESNPELTALIETFNNTIVRNRESIKNTTQHVTNLIQWIDDRFQKEADKRSSAAGKQTVEKKKQDILKFFSEENKSNLINVFNLYVKVASIKELLIDKLQAASKLKTLLRTRNGFEVTGHEGYVVVDKDTNGMVKFVKRLEFSYANFSPDIVKAFEIESR